MCRCRGNRGESSARLTERGQECEQGMLGNQQVSSCVCVRVPPRSKDRLWVIRGQVCTGKPDVLVREASSRLFTQINDLSAEMIHFSRLGVNF